jgi:hypothetical protein
VTYEVIACGSTARGKPGRFGELRRGEMGVAAADGAARPDNGVAGEAEVPFAWESG